MTTNESNHKPINAVNAYIRRLTAGEASPKPENETLKALLARISSTTGPQEIDEETYLWYLGVATPRFMKGSRFCSAEGMVPFRIFWKRSGTYFVRCLDWQQTKILCGLADAPVYE